MVITTAAELETSYFCEILVLLGQLYELCHWSTNTILSICCLETSHLWGCFSPPMCSAFYPANTESTPNPKVIIKMAWDLASPFLVCRLIFNTSYPYHCGSSFVLMRWLVQDRLDRDVLMGFLIFAEETPSAEEAVPKLLSIHWIAVDCKTARFNTHHIF